MNKGYPVMFEAFGGMLRSDVTYQHSLAPDFLFPMPVSPAYGWTEPAGIYYVEQTWKRARFRYDRERLIDGKWVHVYCLESVG